jgi:hypothetical protein
MNDGKGIDQMGKKIIPMSFPETSQLIPIDDNDMHGVTMSYKRR